MSGIETTPNCVTPPTARAGVYRASSSRRRRSAAPGFSLLELMLVVVIIGLLATVVVVSIGGQSDSAREGITIGTLSQVKQAVESYNARHGQYPAQLMQLTAGTNPLLERIPQDAWKRDIFYIHPGVDAGRPYTLFSVGKDGEAGTADDINVWTMDQSR